MREWRKRKAELVEGLRRRRETKAASEVTGARGCCGGWQRGFVRLRRVDALGREMHLRACVEVGLGRGFSGPWEGDGSQDPQCACARLSLFLPPPSESPEFRTVKRGRPLLVAVATVSALCCPAAAQAQQAA